jgi:hypothetical protein
VDPHVLADASGASRREMVAHLNDCAACRERAIDADPSILFALLAQVPIPVRVLDAVSTDVARRAGTDHPSFGDVVASVPSQRRFVAAAAAAVLAIATFYATRVPGPTVALPPVHAKRADVDVHPANAVSNVVDFTVGETQVVMVYNGDLKL